MKTHNDMKMVTPANTLVQCNTVSNLPRLSFSPAGGKEKPRRAKAAIRTLGRMRLKP
jgi:hypothetical protein